MKRLLNCFCMKPYIPAKTVTKTMVVKRYSTVACPFREAVFLIRKLSVTAASGLVNDATIKRH